MTNSEKKTTEIFTYSDISDPSRFMKIMDDGANVYLETSIPIKKDARSLDMQETVERIFMLFCYVCLIVLALKG